MIRFSSTQYEMRRLLRTLTKIGDVGVDSGTVMIVDPCLVLNNLDDDYVGPTYEKFLQVADDNSQKDGSFGHISLEGCFIVETLYGDGTYAIYARKDEKGRIAQVVIDFEQLVEEEDDTTFDDTTFDELEEESLDERDVPDDLA